MIRPRGVPEGRCFRGQRHGRLWLTSGHSCPFWWPDVCQVLALSKQDLGEGHGPTGGNPGRRAGVHMCPQDGTGGGGKTDLEGRGAPCILSPGPRSQGAVVPSRSRLGPALRGAVSRRVPQTLPCCCRRPTETWRPRWCASTAGGTSPAPSSPWPTSTPVSLGLSRGGGRPTLRPPPALRPPQGRPPPALLRAGRRLWTLSLVSLPWGFSLA